MTSIATMLDVNKSTVCLELKRIQDDQEYQFQQANEKQVPIYKALRLLASFFSCFH